MRLLLDQTREDAHDERPFGDSQLAAHLARRVAEKSLPIEGVVDTDQFVIGEPGQASGERRPSPVGVGDDQIHLAEAVATQRPSPQRAVQLTREDQAGGSWVDAQTSRETQIAPGERHQDIGPVRPKLSPQPCGEAEPGPETVWKVEVGQAGPRDSLS